MSITIAPNSFALAVWQRLVIFLAVLVAIIYPYMAGFTGYDKRQGRCRIIIWTQVYGYIVLESRFPQALKKNGKNK